MPLPTQRDHEALRLRLLDWLAQQLPAGSDPKISALSIPEASGFSSETLLFDATWGDEGRRQTGAFVVRTAPDMDDHPIFPSYDLAMQHRCLALVREHTDVPVPRAPWIELDPEPLGAPFFVMERIEGQVPPDNPPYVFGGWLAEASAEQRADFQHRSVEVLAKLHTLEPRSVDLGFLERPEFGESALDQLLGYQRYYYDWARKGVTYPSIERAFDWLEAHRPESEGPSVLNWGDSRIGNIMYRDFRPVAVLDWEMAAVGAPEADLAWMVHMHDFFADFADQAGLPGLPGFLRWQDVTATYEQLTGRDVRNFPFYAVFAGLRYMIISIQIGLRGIAYGQMERPSDLDELLMNRGVVERMMSGEYWD